LEESLSYLVRTIFVENRFELVMHLNGITYLCRQHGTDTMCDADTLWRTAKHLPSNS